jgi:hypothetical protein
MKLHNIFVVCFFPEPLDYFSAASWLCAQDATWVDERVFLARTSDPKKLIRDLQFHLRRKGAFCLFQLSDLRSISGHSTALTRVRRWLKRR